MNGLEKVIKVYKTYGLYDKILFGRCKGDSIKEMIDDGQEDLISYYLVNIDEFQLTQEAQAYLNYKC